MTRPRTSARTPGVHPTMTLVAGARDGIGRLPIRSVNNATVDQIVADCGYDSAGDGGGLPSNGSCFLDWLAARDANGTVVKNPSLEIDAKRDQIPDCWQPSFGTISTGERSGGAAR